jgi:hypothetical protein
MHTRGQYHVVVGIVLGVGLFLATSAMTQPLPPSDLRQHVQSFKKDPRGPYQSVNWFCPDGSVRPAQSPCTQPGGLQHAMLKDIVKGFQQHYGLYLGQILAGTPFDAFLDRSHHGMRMKQYQMEQFLRAVDDGWIFRRAQYYRGALQAEDEEAWGLRFLTWLLAQDDWLQAHFFLARQVIQDIPHQAREQTLKRIRTLSKSIADALPAFTELRVKIHGQPDAGDLVRVKFFHIQHREQLTPEIQKMLRDLEQALTAAYQSSDADKLSVYQRTLSDEMPLIRMLNALLTPSMREDISARSHALADLLWHIRTRILDSRAPQRRLALLDLSITLEEMLGRDIGSWQPRTLGDLLRKIYLLAKAAAGSGFLEVWEWQRSESVLRPPEPNAVVELDQLRHRMEAARRLLEWGAGMTRTVYEPVVHLFASFEPLALGFVDDRIRASVLLSLGDAVGQLAARVAAYSGLSNEVLGIKIGAQMRGLNPGLTLGELMVSSAAPEGISYSANKIYVLSWAPADLQPVAGIATVSEGNLVSHVQLLARNLGIPNAVLTAQALRDLLPFSGEQVFYAVSPRGTVWMKRATEMTPEERAVVEERRRVINRITVPTDKMDLKAVGLPSLYDVRAADAGRICGPKAANLGQLSALFPSHVAPGLVVPFGVFRQHLDQPMPGTPGSYWDFLQATFAATRPNNAGADIVLQRLAQLRRAIVRIPLQPAFIEALEKRFQAVFGRPFGQVPIFVRSDTNMEDLKDFTGAGLNLTVANVLSVADILQAIREVWASPYTERSYRWRQRYLDNPEHVYPSLVLLRSVNVDKSGVMITTGVSAPHPEDITVAFNRGVGGAVEGQRAESYLLNADGSDTLLAPARALYATILPPQGGVEKVAVSLDRPILSPDERAQLRQLANDIRQRLPGTPGIASNGPFDVELGFLKGMLWLFQVRPFVESKQAQSSAYLRALDVAIPRQSRIPLTASLEEQP